MYIKKIRFVHIFVAASREDPREEGFNNLSSSVFPVSYSIIRVLISIESQISRFAGPSRNQDRVCYRFEKKETPRYIFIFLTRLGRIYFRNYTNHSLISPVRGGLK